MTHQTPLAHLHPQPLWQHFQMLCDTPRPSRHEAALIEKIAQFAKRHRLECLRDAVGNVMLRKPASAGMTNRRGVVLQSHLDMVPQKNADTHHDFTRDPIEAQVDGDWVTAKGTTLGADNGIGVAAILAIMEAKDIAHGPLEALFTVDEEAGMTGAKGLGGQLLHGELLFNLDTEAEGEFYVGCAGGIDVTATLSGDWQPVDGTCLALQLQVGGLLGGHSGLDIHLGRANANQVVATFIARLSDALPVRIAALCGGTLRNAIAREAQALIVVPGHLRDAVCAAFDKFHADMADRYGPLETKMALALTDATAPTQALSADQSRQLVSALLSCPHGSQRMSTALPGIVETSNNLASVSLIDRTIQIKCLIRSLLDQARDDLAATVARHFQLIGADTHLDGAYPGWTPNMASPLLAQMRAVYRALHGREAGVKVIHAGLECGLLGATYPNWDMISFGPTIRGAHSPDERVHIGSVAAFWDTLVAGLAAVPERP